MAERSIAYTFIGRFGNLRTGLAAAGRDVQTFGTRLTALDRDGRKARRALTSVGTVAGRVSLGIAAGLALSAKAAVDWESAWAGVTKTVDGSSDQLERLEEDLREMARTMPATHEEIAAVAEAAGQLGVEVDSVAAFTKTMLQLGETTNLTAEQAATSIARIANVMGTADDDIDNLGAALVDLGNNSATTEAEILTFAQRISAAGEIAGLSESDVLAFGASLSSVGVQAEAGGTALSKAFTAINDAVTDGSDDLETFAQVAGVSVDEFTRRFEADAAGAIALFIEGLGEMNAAGESTSGVLDDVGLSQERTRRALLSTAEAGGLLRDSLNLSEEAWDENTALVEEYGKRAETTGAEARVAWNNIKDAAIDAGDVLLPLVSEGAQGVSSLAQAFGSLPGPAKSATTSLLGITAIFGGGLWFTSRVINGVVSMRGAIADLGISSPRAARGLRGVARGATLAGAALGGLAVIDTLQVQSEEAELSVGELAASLLDLAATGQGSLPNDLDGLADSVDRLANPNKAQAFQDNIAGIIGFGGGSELENATRDVEALDAALTEIATMQGPEEAVAAFEAVAKEAGIATGSLSNELGVTSSSLGDLLDQLPGYRDALASSSDASDDSADASGKAADGFDSSGEAAEGAAGAIEDLNEATREHVEAAGDAFAAETSWREALKSAEKQARSNTAGIDGNSKAALENRRELDNLRTAWNSQSDAVRQNERRQREARRQFIRTARQMGINEDRARRLARRLLDFPEKVETDVDVDTRNARRQIRSVKSFLRSIPNNIPVRVTVTGNTANGGRSLLGGVPLADGGTVPGPRAPYRDSVPLLAAPGEEMISNDRGQADRWRPLLKAINDNRMADGGTVRIPASSGGGSSSATAAGIAAAMGSGAITLSSQSIAELADALTTRQGNLYIDRDAAGKFYITGRDRAEVRA